MELGLPLLDPERGLLGPGLELLAHPPEVLLGIAIGVEGLDLIDRFVEVGIESLNILIGRSALLRTAARPRCASASNSASSSPVTPSRRAGKTFLVEIEFETEDLFIGGNVFPGGCSSGCCLIGLHSPNLRRARPADGVGTR